MGSKGLLGLVLCFVACGESSSSGRLVRAGTAGTFPDSSTGNLGTGGKATGGQANGAGGATTRQCQSDRDCTPFRLLCDHARSRCVDCLVEFDCEPGQRCRAGACETPIQCSNSLDCVGAPNGRVICDQAASNCVECVTTADCGTGVCDNTRCTIPPVGAGGAANGGNPGSGGTFDTGGSTSDTGGAAETGGSTNDTGGLPGSGGSLETGGAPTGGRPNTGGFQSTGGFWFTGGFTSTGGRAATGGFVSTGGRASTGGTAGTGGSGTCVVSQCPVCSAILGTACCTTAGMCGCTYLVPGYCL